MDGYLAHLPEICGLADKYGAMVMVDDSHAVGFMGKTGRGTHEYHQVMGRIDILHGHWERPWVEQVVTRERPPRNH
jgi:glycine C-acetyltransferase